MSCKHLIKSSMKVFYTKLLSKNVSKLLQSYTADGKFRILFEELRSESHYPSQADVPQDSVLGLIVYSIYTAYIPVTSKRTVAVFADDTAVISVSDMQIAATSH